MQRRGTSTRGRFRASPGVRAPLQGDRRAASTRTSLSGTKGQITGVIGIARDISYRRLSEENLRSARQGTEISRPRGCHLRGHRRGRKGHADKQEGAEALGCAEAGILGKTGSTAVPARMREEIERRSNTHRRNGGVRLFREPHPCRKRRREDDSVAQHGLKVSDGNIYGTLSSGATSRFQARRGRIEQVPLEPRGDIPLGQGRDNNHRPRFHHIGA